MAFFSIIIPAYNRANIIERAVISVLTQTYTNFELIIADDGSSDNTKDVIKKYLADERVHYYYQQNKGVCAARNFGTTKSSGNYLIFLDSDDHVEPGWLNDFYNILKDIDNDIAFCNMKVMSPSGEYKLVNAGNPYNDNITKGMYIAGLFAVKRQLFIDAGMYDEKMKFGENTELGYRLKEKKLQTAFVENYNIIYSPSVEGGSKNLYNKLYSNLYILEKHKLYFGKNLRSKKLFMKVAAVAAARLGKYKLARKIFHDTLIADKGDIKLMLQFLLSYNKHIARLKWKPQKKNN